MILLDASGRPIEHKGLDKEAAQALVLRRFAPFLKLASSLAPPKVRRDFRAVVEKWLLAQPLSELVPLQKYMMVGKAVDAATVSGPAKSKAKNLTPGALAIARGLLAQYVAHSNKANLLLPTRGQIVCVK